ncbi:hypothetical protein G6F24_015554 [Rhizopus arrhizus]|nr:hypothetical protein G6F24_015554 [Rhizopus arrhizus]
MGAAQQSGYVLCVHPVGGVRHQQAERGVEQGGIHALAAPGARAVVQRQQDARLRGVARQVVHDGDADAGGAAGGVSVHAHQSAHGLQDGVVAR